MERVYKFESEEPLLFDDTKTVKELIQYAFTRFGYYEPVGMEIVTLFQPQARTSCGWFTTDTSRLCADEIVNTENLCFAYHMPDVFYFAEGGWGHHMSALGNHPRIDNPVSLHIRFDGFNHTVVINGKYTFADIIRFLKRTEYLTKKATTLWIRPINPYSDAYPIFFSSDLMSLPLTEFEKKLPEAVVLIDIC